MSFSLFGGSRPALPAGWRQESVTTIIGGTDLVAAEPGDGATLKLTSVIGKIRVAVPAGTPVTLRGWSLLGERRNQAAEGGGKPVTVVASTVIGEVEIVESA
ncbi:MULTISPECIES: hypothetical protein [Amycolatopsis]|uniref:Cell wall-active antibiotics response LiaF-like C-terminal domain-containing protein n=1 Tax=Amycolatopsis albidoflavus TaxID=102226 RepID=A0ABW5I5E2_9PSEU